jgi:uracil-DNA glycosylase
VHLHATALDAIVRLERSAFKRAMGSTARIPHVPAPSPGIEAAGEPALGALAAAVRGCFACASMAYVHTLSEANGQVRSRVLFVAEAAGRKGAAITGVPLSGDESGWRFESFLRVAGLERRDVFVTNAVLCNPLDNCGRNRTPDSRELAACRPFLARTIEIVDPPVVVALGRVALASLRAIADHHATLRDAGSVVGWQGRTLVPMYHPGRQSTLHRSHDGQEADWRRLGDFLRATLAANPNEHASLPYEE